MPNRMSIADAALLIRNNLAPALLIDTCAAIDVIRAPGRDEAAHQGCIAAADTLIRAATSNPKALSTVVTELVWNEWEEHAPREQENLTSHIGKLDRQVTKLQRACGESGITPLPPQAYASLDLPRQLLGISSRLMDSAIMLAADPRYEHLGYRRSVECRPPTRKGTQAKDCDIIEHYLALGRELRAAGFGHRLVFVTSNTKDYCSTGVVLHRNLETELGAAGMAFTTNLAWALTELRLQE